MPEGDDEEQKEPAEEIQMQEIQIEDANPEETKDLESAPAGTNAAPAA